MTDEICEIHSKETVETLYYKILFEWDFENAILMKAL